MNSRILQGVAHYRRRYDDKNLVPLESEHPAGEIQPPQQTLEATGKRGPSVSLGSWRPRVNAELETAAVLARQRLRQLLDDLRSQGLSQQQIAQRANVPAAYLSQLKHGDRDITELVARRLGDEFDLDFEWLLVRSAVPQRPKAGPAGVWLPLFDQPIEGDPQTHPAWDGASVQVAGPAAARDSLAPRAYVLRFAGPDAEGRLHAGDLVLMAQLPAEAAEIHVVRYRGRLRLARRAPDGRWRRVGDGRPVPTGGVPVGHVVAVIWSDLSRPAVSPQ
jgi:transcriptional regulator with XRE-family HTH domain